MKQALYWFRLWELLARARLQISDNNLGLAAADIETALSLASSIPEAATEVETEILATITTRLELAAQELPDEPVTSARDLESAWDIIDQVIAEFFDVLGSAGAFKWRGFLTGFIHFATCRRE